MTKSKTIFYWILGFIFVLGIFFRVYFWGMRDTFEDDECRLILAFIEKSWAQMFLSLGDAQSAPPFFIIPVRILGNLSGYNEHILKLFPLLTGISSLFVFYKLSKKFFLHGYSILIAVFLFAVNIKLITFSSIVKQYSLDTLVCLLLLYFFPNINIKELTPKKLTALAAILAILPLISLPSLFFVGALFILNIAKNREVIRNLIILCIPSAIILVLYYFFNLAPSKESLTFYFPNYWDDGFINFKNPLSIFVLNFRWFFMPNMLTLLEFILFITGIYYIIVKPCRLNKLIIYCTLLVFLASAFHIYPFYNRVALYFFPIIILLCVKPLDSVAVKSKLFPVFLICLLSGFWMYNYYYFQNLVTDKSCIINYSSKKLIYILKENYKPETEVILVNNASSSSFMFYSSKASMDTAKAYEIRLDDNSINYSEYFKNLESNRKYWIYLVKDFTKNPLRPVMMNYIKLQDIIFMVKDRDSYLILFYKK